MKLPWWLNPWRGHAQLTARNTELYARLQASASELERLRDIISIADQQVRDLTKANNSLRGQLAAAVTGARTSGAALSTAKPDFIMTGIPRGKMGVRIQVSRDIEVTAFAMTEMGDGEPRFKIGAIMARLLVIDKPTYSEALAHLATIWANQDRDEQPGARLTPVSGPLQLPGG